MTPNRLVDHVAPRSPPVAKVSVASVSRLVSGYPILTPMSAVEGDGERSECARAHIQWLRKFPGRVVKHLRQKNSGKAFSL